MRQQTQPEMLFAEEQYRMSRLQVYNWGTFSGLHDVPISERGFLFVGRSGTGKSTLLDAFSALLIPPRWVDFNAAAREGDKSRRDRNFASYIRGAWAEQKDGDSGEIATRHLRTGTTWSALALSYRNTMGQIVVLVQVFWIRGNANSNTDVKRHYLVFEREFEIRDLDDFGKSDFDIRKLKQSFPDAFSRDDFSSYRERFCRLLGIENEAALKLLNKTQSAKNLGDLNIFLRDFMLDKPLTFDVADRLVNEFDELNAAHQSVVTARKQIELLIPAREKHHQMETITVKLHSINALQEGINSYRETLRMDLLKEYIAKLIIEVDGLKGETTQRQGILDNHKSILQDLEHQHREIGGDRIEQLEDEKKSLEGQRAERLRKREQAAAACSELGWALGDTPQDFAKLVGSAREEIEGLENKSNAARDEQLTLSITKEKAGISLSAAVKEVRALERQPSNIPADMLDMRGEIALAIGLSESALPFVGELIEVKQNESSWQGAIERVLRGFALSILVDERNYPALSNHINNTHLGRRLVYYRTGQIDQWQEKPINNDSMVLKLNVKEGNYSNWLKAELRQRFNYSCVESVQAFRAGDRALTREGQVKHSKTRHEKDDRRHVDDRRSWVLGFDNKDKLVLFQQQAQEQAAIISDCDQKIDLISNQNRESILRARHCQTLSDLQWQEIDVVPLQSRISAIENLLRETREGNTELQEVAKRIDEHKTLVLQAEEALRNTMVACEGRRKQIENAENKLETLKSDSTIVQLPPEQKAGLDEYYGRHAGQGRLVEHIQLDNLDITTDGVRQTLSKEAEKLNRDIASCEKHIENVFADFKRTWQTDASDLDATLSSAQEFFAKLTRLETDGLPAHEQRFFDLLQKQSSQNLAELSTRLNDARKDILERMVLVNDSLRQVPFNKTLDHCTYLSIEASDRQLQDVREFKQNIRQALDYTLSHAINEERELAESRFLVLRKLVERLSSHEPEEKRWRESVLDVRQHVEFIGREKDESGVEVEIYRSGAGKSGGQRQKLATTCLAAALRYQLGGIDHGFPIYAPVILDEAFDKADNEFTALAMNIFNNFGFQMIVATPLRSVMTLEPFIAGACFVDIKDRCVSSVLNIEYDSDRQRLNLPDHTQRGGSIETS